MDYSDDMSIDIDVVIETPEIEDILPTCDVVKIDKDDWTLELWVKYFGFDGYTNSLINEVDYYFKNLTLDEKKKILFNTRKLKTPGSSALIKRTKFKSSEKMDTRLDFVLSAAKYYEPGKIISVLENSDKGSLPTIDALIKNVEDLNPGDIFIAEMDSKEYFNLMHHRFIYGDDYSNTPIIYLGDMSFIFSSIAEPWSISACWFDFINTFPNHKYIIQLAFNNKCFAKISTIALTFVCPRHKKGLDRKKCMDEIDIELASLMTENDYEIIDFHNVDYRNKTDLRKRGKGMGAHMHYIRFDIIHNSLK